MYLTVIHISLSGINEITKRELNMAHGERAAYLRNRFKELWGRRPFSGFYKHPSVKKLCRRLERRISKREIYKMLHE